MLDQMPLFRQVVDRLNQWLADMMDDHSAGVLVSHNTATDVQFLLVEYLRASKRLPAKIKLCLDTYKTLTRFSSVLYRKVPVDEWKRVCVLCENKGLTKKGKLSMGVKPCATYALSKRTPPKTFLEACGAHHDAEADTRAVAAILFDRDQFGQGLYNCVFETNRRCFQPIQEIQDAMIEKMKEPVVLIEDVPSGWKVVAPLEPDNVLSGSGHELPDGVDEVTEPTFEAPQRGEGQPSPRLRRHLGVGTARTGATVSAITMMVQLFLFFFSLGTLTTIAECTNQKATEFVYKSRYRRSDGSTHYKVCLKHTHTHTLALTRAPFPPLRMTVLVYAVGNMGDFFYAFQTTYTYTLTHAHSLAHTCTRTHNHTPLHIMVR